MGQSATSDVLGVTLDHGKPGVPIPLRDGPYVVLSLRDSSGIQGVFLLYEYVPSTPPPLPPTFTFRTSPGPGQSHFL